MFPNSFLSGFQTEIESLEIQLAERREVVSNVKADVKHNKEILAKNNKEINAEQSKSAKISKAIEEKKLKIQELKHKITKVCLCNV